MENPVVVTFPSVKIAQYVINLLENSSINWKDAILHNTALQALSNGVVIDKQKVE